MASDHSRDIWFVTDHPTRFLWLALVLVMGTLGCDDPPMMSVPDATPDGPIPDGDVPDAELLPCSPALGFVDAPGYANPFQVTTLTPTGGTGDYRFSLIADPSGGDIATVTGAYVAGAATDVTDVIQVTDVGCEGEATTEILVVDSMLISPESVTTTPMSAFTFNIERGSGSYTFAMQDAGSGGSVDMATGRYVAGAMTGRDSVRITDEQTGETRLATIQVSEEAGITPSASQLFLPVGTSANLPGTGASGHYVATVPAGDETILRVAGDQILGQGPGRTTLTLTDRFTAVSVDIPVQVMSPASDEPFVAGMQDYDADLIAPGDLNGDGFTDLVVGSPLADGSRFRSGAVWVYAGTADGFETVPAQVFEGTERNGRFGDGFAIADVWGDANLDLVVGTWNGNGIFNASGYVDIFPGVEGGFFETTSAHRLHSLRGGDQLGRSVAICDFNGDGELDIATGALGLEDFGSMPVAFGQGAVAVYYGSETGYSVSPDQVIYGVSQSDTGWTGERGLGFGRILVAGDFTGDGTCDLVASQVSPQSHYLRNNDGGIFYYRGVAAEPGSRGGLEGLPYRAIVGILDPEDRLGDESSHLGHDMDAFDVNEDGRLDIVAGQYALNVGGSTDIGAVHIFLSGEDMGGSVSILEDAQTVADLTLVGHASYGNFGRAVQYTTLRADGQASLLIAERGYESSALGIPSNAGAVHLYDRTDEADLGFSRTLSAGGTEGGLNAGTQFTALPDGLGLAMYNASGYSLGHRSGEIAFHAYRPAEGEMPEAFAPAVTLNLTATATGAHVGHSVAIVGDVTGNGYPDLVVGTPYREPRVARQIYSWTNQGGVYVYPGTATGFDTTSPPLELAATFGMRDGDLGGYTVAPAGDFNRDGRADFLVVVRHGDRNRGTETGVDPVARNSACDGGGRDNVGSVLVFLGVGPGETLAEPSFVGYGARSGSQYLYRAAGGFDFNGDGYDDILASTPRTTGTVGRVFLFEGRELGSLPPGKSIRELCEGQTDWFGEYSNQNYGHSLSGLGDIDGDGCDEYIVGIPRYGDETAISVSRGAVDIHFGWSDAPGSSCASEPRRLRMISGSVDARAGTSVSGGHDVDGDGIPDVVVGAPRARSGEGSVGRAYVIRGAYIRDNTPLNGADRPIVTMLPADGRRLAIDGPSNGSFFGESVALVPNLAGDGRAGILVGGYRAGYLGTTQSGVALAYRVTNASGEWQLESRPYLAFLGESEGTEPQFGFSVSASISPPVAGNSPLIAIGAPYSSGVSAEWGASYALEVQR